MLCIKIRCPIMDKFKASLRQLFSAMAVNLVTFSYGVYSAWPAVVQNALQSESSPVGRALDNDSFTWIASLGMCGALFGTLFWGVVADRCGRKITGYLTILPFLVNWTILLTVDTEWALHLARFVGGVGASGAAVNCPTYVSELSDERMKDVLGSLFMLTYNLGVLFVFVVGTYVDYAWLNAAGLAVGVLFAAVWYHAPESPVYLLRCNREQEAWKQLRWLRGKDEDEDVKAEAKAMATEIGETSEDTKCSAYFERSTLKALLVGFVFQTGTQLSGINVILTYAVDIFERSGSNLSPSVCTILVGSVQVTASVFGSCLVKRFSRKFFMVTTYLLTAGALFTMGWCLDAGRSLPVAATNTGLLPVVSLSLHVIAFSLGLGMVPYIVYTEIFPANVRNVCISALMFWNHALGFAVVKACGQHMRFESFWALATACLLIVPYTWLCVPETKGKSFETIQRELRTWFPGLGGGCRGDGGDADDGGMDDDKIKIPPHFIENGQVGALATPRIRERGAVSCSS